MQKVSGSTQIKNKKKKKKKHEEFFGESPSKGVLCGSVMSTRLSTRLSKCMVLHKVSHVATYSRVHVESKIASAAHEALEPHQSQCLASAWLHGGTRRWR